MVYTIGSWFTIPDEPPFNLRCITKTTILVYSLGSEFQIPDKPPLNLRHDRKTTFF